MTSLPNVHYAFENSNASKSYKKAHSMRFFILKDGLSKNSLTIPKQIVPKTWQTPCTRQQQRCPLLRVCCISQKKRAPFPIYLGEP